MSGRRREKMNEPKAVCTGSEPEYQAMDHSLNLLKDTYNYNHWIYSLLRPYIGNVVAEIGSGQGNVTRFLLDCGKVICVEPNPVYLEMLKELSEIHHNIEPVEGDDSVLQLDQFKEKEIDTVVCINVLEHIEDDNKTLKRFYDSLVGHGKLLLYVPACQWAYGEMDKGLGHYRRYSKAELKHKVRNAGFEVEHCMWVNTPGVFGWWWAGKIKKEPFIDPKKARLVDRYVPFLLAFERLFPPLLGQSLLLVGEKKAIL
jgi:SAM-dependent methyltransferase